MSTLAEIGEGLERAWGSIAEGWRQLRQRATQALTRFNPVATQADVETAGEQFLQNASRWGLLTVDVSENDDEVRVRLEVPGMDADDFDIQVIGNVLVVRGEKRVERDQVEGHFHVIECAYGSFERAVPLPAEVDEQGAKARYKRGVLTVRLPKKTTARKQRIEVAH